MLILKSLMDVTLRMTTVFPWLGSPQNHSCVQMLAVILLGQILLLLLEIASLLKLDSEITICSSLYPCQQRT